MPTEISPENFEKFVQERKYLFNVSPKTELSKSGPRECPTNPARW